MKTIFEAMDRMPDELPHTVNDFAKRHRSNAKVILSVLKPKSKLYDLHNEYHRSSTVRDQIQRMQQFYLEEIKVQDRIKGLKEIIDNEEKYLESLLE